jgi:hypothetical protein
MENKIQKPMIIEVAEAKNEIVQCINNAIQMHKLPCYIIDLILSEVSAQVKMGANNELTSARKQMMQYETGDLNENTGV